MIEKQAFFSLLGGKISMLRSNYNPTADAVWLASCIPNKTKSMEVLDIGIGTGGISTCLNYHNNKLHITGIDKSEAMLNVCMQNLQLNSIEAYIINQDIFCWKTDKTFDLVVTNPPYFNGTPAHHDAHHNADIKKWCEISTARVKPNGYFCIIVDSLVIDKVISVLCNKNFGNIEIFPLFSIREYAERVMIRAKLGVKTGVKVYQGLDITDKRILMDGLTIDDLLTTLRTK